MKKIYNTTGTCARQILLDINDDKTVNSVEFVGGCNGNLQGIAALVKGKRLTMLFLPLKVSIAILRALRVPTSWQRRLRK